MSRWLLSLLALAGLTSATAFAFPAPCYNFEEPASCNATLGCYWDNYGQICASTPPGPVGVPPIGPVGPVGPGPGPGAPVTFTSYCLSNGLPATCPVNGQVVSVYLTQQLPGGPCIFGQTWSYDARDVYTSNGCRAYFTVTYYPYY